MKNNQENNTVFYEKTTENDLDERTIEHSLEEWVKSIKPIDITRFFSSNLTIATAHTSKIKKHSKQPKQRAKRLKRKGPIRTIVTMQKFECYPTTCSDAPNKDLEDKTQFDAAFDFNDLNKNDTALSWLPAPPTNSSVQILLNDK